MPSTARVRLRVLSAVLVLLAEAPDALAQRLACVPILTDETVASAAQRVTGDARNMRESWFQIVNPTTARWVPKGRYDLIFAGWNACIVNHPDGVPPARLERAIPRPQPAAAFRPGTPIARIDASFAALGTVAVWCTLVLTIALACWGDDFFRKRERVLRTMKRFADRFVQEFERPLIQQHLPGRPIESRVRFKPVRSRLDVLIAPHAGLRYPNLADHKSNVIYDVARVQEVLRDPAFVSRRPYARGRWVVVPFQLRIDIREAGGR